MFIRLPYSLHFKGQRGPQQLFRVCAELLFSLVWFFLSGLGESFFFPFKANWEKVKVKVAQSCLTCCNPMDYTVHGILQARILEWAAFPFFRLGSQPRDQTQTLHCRLILYQLSLRGSPRILEWVVYPFSRGSSLTQELNRGLLNCRQILYQLSYQGSPNWEDLTQICVRSHLPQAPRSLCPPHCSIFPSLLAWLCPQPHLQGFSAAGPVREPTSPC